MNGKPFIRVHDLSVGFRMHEREIEAVKRISFEIHHGETVALVGESGSGKSVSALSILQLLPYPMAHHPEGSSIEIDGEEVVGAPEAVLRRIRGNRISMVFQEPMTSLNPLQTLETQIAEVLLIHQGMNRDQARARVVELLHLVGCADLTKRLKAYPHELSGGQRQRVMIAMALANEPDLLIADEPTTSLDVTVQAQILKLLRELQEKLGMAMLLITHDLGIVRRMAKNVCVMKDGAIVEKGPSEEIFRDPRHAYTKHLLTAAPKGGPLSAPKDAPMVMECDDLKVHFPIKRGVMRHTVGFVKAVDGVTIRVREGHTIGVVGESGSGKSSFAYGLLRLGISSGPIRFEGHDIQGLGFRRLRPLRQRMQIVFQDPYGSLSPRLTVGDIVGEGLRVHGVAASAEERRRIVGQALAEVGLETAMQDRYPHEFSGGQRQRISIARAFVLKPRFVVLDEPTSALDMSVQAQIVDLLRDLQKKYRLAYLFISHDLKVVRALADEIIVLHGGKVVEQGAAEEIFERPQDDYTKALIAAAFALEADESGIVKT
jgi:microcin C transport system ATP-binding protein